MVQKRAQWAPDEGDGHGNWESIQIIPEILKVLRGEIGDLLKCVKLGGESCQR